MPLYTGKSADGSDMKEFSGGFFVSPNGKYWSSKPISLEEEKEIEKALAGTKFDVNKNAKKK